MIVLIALLSAAAVVAVRLPLANAQLQHSISQLKMLDASARRRARSGEDARIVFDLESSTARVTDSRDRDLVPMVQLPRGHHFVRVLGTEKQSESARSVRYDRFGTSRTFAVEIGSKAENNSWLLVLGMSGQSYLTKERGPIDAIVDRERNYPR